jgi:hypothetical protein
MAAFVVSRAQSMRVTTEIDPFYKHQLSRAVHACLRHPMKPVRDIYSLRYFKSSPWASEPS